jgi:hypothetical protein
MQILGFAPWQEVRSGQKHSSADNVRFTPESGHQSGAPSCPLRAIFYRRQMQNVALQELDYQSAE